MAPRVLIVDDTLASQQTIEGMLFKEGYQLDLADSGWECLDYLESQKPDLILLDVMMPGLSGYDVCRRLKESKDYRHIPIILLTALNKREDVLQGLEAGADEFVSKPVAAAELRARVRNLLRMKQMHDDLQRTLEFRQDLTRFLVHDMRNPLISIRLASELELLNGGSETSPTFKKILREVQTLQGYVDEMLIAASLEGSAFQLDLARVELGSFVASWLGEQTCWRGAEIQVKVPSEEITLELDPDLMKRVLENLVGNAVKYAPDLPIELVVLADSRAASLSVKDQGPGVPPEHRKRIWEKLGTVPLRKAGLRQFGLGLYFCRLVAEAHSGTIELSDNSPRGSVFTITLPLASSSQEPSTETP